jgi:hypothetical protein
MLFFFLFFFFCVPRTCFLALCTYPLALRMCSLAFSTHSFPHARRLYSAYMFAHLLHVFFTLCACAFTLRTCSLALGTRHVSLRACSLPLCTCSLARRTESLAFCTCALALHTSSLSVGAHSFTLRAHASSPCPLDPSLDRQNRWSIAHDFSLYAAAFLLCVRNLTRDPYFSAHVHMRVQTYMNP